MNLTNLSFGSIFNRISSKDRTFFVRQLSIMVSSGIPIANALNLAIQQTGNEALRQVLRVMVKDIENGHSLSMAAARFPDVFDTITIAMFKSGEASGQMTVVLDQLANQLERSNEFFNKVRNALLYPMFVLFVMVVVGVIMATAVIPRLAEIFDETNLTLPWSTQLLVVASNIIVQYWYVVLLVLIMVGITTRNYFKTPSGREVFYRFQMKIPVIRELALNSYLVRFTSILNMLIKAGVPFTEALGIVSDSMSNYLWTQALKVVKQEVERGIPLSAAMSRHPMFPKALIQMIAVGEQTGKMDTVLDNMTAFYEEQTNTAVKAITTLIEPVVLVIVAVGVGFVVISVILPIYGLAEQF